MTRRPSHPGIGLVVYHGPSLLNGEHIVAILTTHSNNRKIGDLPQLWILHASMPPADAARSGRDASVCGDCPLRGDGKHRGGYVDLVRGPRSVWDAWKRGRYRDAWGCMPDVRGQVPTAFDPVLPGRPSRHAPGRRTVHRAASGDRRPHGPARSLRRPCGRPQGRARGRGRGGGRRLGRGLHEPVAPWVRARRSVHGVLSDPRRRRPRRIPRLPRFSLDSYRGVAITGDHDLSRVSRGRLSSHVLTMPSVRGRRRGETTAHVQIAAHGSESSTKRYALQVLQDRA